MCVYILIQATENAQWPLSLYISMLLDVIHCLLFSFSFVAAAAVVCLEKKWNNPTIASVIFAKHIQLPCSHTDQKPQNRKIYVSKYSTLLGHSGLACPLLSHNEFKLRLFLVILGSIFMNYWNTNPIFWAIICLQKYAHWSCTFRFCPTFCHEDK